MQLLGVRQHILLRGHVDGYRLVRLTDAQLRGFPFTPMELWRLSLLRTAHVVFKLFTKGLACSGACPVSVICDVLQRDFGCRLAALSCAVMSCGALSLAALLPCSVHT